MDWFLFWISICRHSTVMAFFPESCMKKGKWWSAICNYKQSYKSPCVSSMKLKQNIKDSLYYSELIYIHFRPKNLHYWNCNLCLCSHDIKKSCLQPLHVNWKIVCCLHLVPPMPLYYGLEDSSCSTEWINVYYKHICGKFWMVLSLLLMNSSYAHNRNHGNSQLKIKFA